jgi:hypothetical protein
VNLAPRTRITGRTAIAALAVGAALVAPSAVFAAEGPEVVPTTVGSTESPANITECPVGTTFLFEDSGEETQGAITVELEYDQASKTVDFTVTGGVALHAFVKGGPAYNDYDYSPLAGVAQDDGLVAPDNGSGDAAGLSHALVCVAEAEEEEESPSEDVETPSPDGSVEGEVGTPRVEVTPPPTDAIGGEGRSSDPSMLLVLLASIAVVAGLGADRARARARR